MKFLLLAALAVPGLTLSASGGTPDAEAWTKILGAVGLRATADAQIQVVAGDSSTDVASLAVDHIVIVEGTGPAAESLGIHASSGQLFIRQISDVHGPRMQTIWEQPVTVPAVELPADFQVFATEKWKRSPVLAGKRTKRGGVLWIATSPGPNGFERYPYLLQALADLGSEPLLRSADIWAFFDSSYRIRADVDYLARRWRNGGISALHVAAWHNIDRDPSSDEYLARLIEACHRNAILVYAWFELPHVSEKFWNDHPEWREKTAAGQDAQLDWRKLMNLQNRDCSREAGRQVNALLNRFDWDGVNLAELYFESLEGASNPARFTPMNDNVRAEFKEISGFDAKLLFDSTSPYAKDAGALRKFLDFRAVLASRMQSDWLKQLDGAKKLKPYLDVVLTHIDDRFDPAIRDELGADVARSLPLLEARKDTLLVEDPANLWNLGPERYTKLAQKYTELTPKHAGISVDVNVVDRYQDVYPTKKQTGVELFELVHQAAKSFAHVALYFENSLEKQDLSLLSAAASTAQWSPHGADQIDVQCAQPTRVAWHGPVEMDGRTWPIQNERYVLMPPGQHRLSAGVVNSAITISDFNGDVHSATAVKSQIEIAYSSRTRAIATMTKPVSAVQIDGAPFWSASDAKEQLAVLLPAGQHVATFIR